MSSSQSVESRALEQLPAEVEHELTELRIGLDFDNDLDGFGTMDKPLEDCLTVAQMISAIIGQLGKKNKKKTLKTLAAHCKSRKKRLRRPFRCRKRSTWQFTAPAKRRTQLYNQIARMKTNPVDDSNGEER